MRNKNIVLGIIIPLFFILISSNVLGNVYVGNSDGLLLVRGYANEQLYDQDFGSGVILHEIYVPDEFEHIFVRVGLNSIRSINKTGSSFEDLQNWAITGNNLAYHTRFYTQDGTNIRERNPETSNIIETFSLESSDTIRSFETYNDFLFIRYDNYVDIYNNNTFLRTINLNFTGQTTPLIRSIAVDENYIYTTKRRMGSGIDNELRVFDYEGNLQYNIVLDFVDTLLRPVSPRTIKVKDNIIYVGGDNGRLALYHTNGTFIQRTLTLPYDGNINDIDVDDAGFIYIASGDSVLLKLNPSLNIVWFRGLFSSSGRSVGVQGTSLNHKFTEYFESDFELEILFGGVLKWGGEFYIDDTLSFIKPFGTQSWFVRWVSDIGFNENVTGNLTYTYDDITNITIQYNFTTPDQPPIPLPILTENSFNIIDNVPRFSVSLRRFSFSSFNFPDYLFNFETSDFECIETYAGEYCGVLDNVYVVINDVEFPLEILYKPESEVERVGAYTIYDGNVYNSRHELINETEWSGETIFYLGNVGSVNLPTGKYTYYFKSNVYDTSTEEFYVLISDTYEFELNVPRAEWKSYFEPVKNVPSHLGSDNWSTGFRTLVVFVGLFLVVFLIFIFANNNGIEILFLPLAIIGSLLLILYFTISGVIPFWVFLLIILIGGFILFKRFSS